MTKQYSFEVIRQLSEEEASSFIKDRYPALISISSRYLPEIDLKKGFPSGSEYLDALRTSWLLDKSDSRPPHVVMVRALGMALGLALNRTFHLKWSLIKDSFGESVSLIGNDTQDGQVSIPPFSYVEKREHVQNAEVFSDMFNLLATKLPQASA
jgi:hypothetical protein